MYCIAEQVGLPPLKEEERKALVEKAARLRVSAILDAVSDPRKRQGVRYELAFLLTCLLAALLCNCNSTLFGDRSLLGQHLAALRATQNEEFSTEDYLAQADAESLKQVFLFQKDHRSHRTQTASQEALAQVATDGSVPIDSDDLFIEKINKIIPTLIETYFRYKCDQWISYISGAGF